MGKKQLAMLASGTMNDVVFSGIKWFPLFGLKEPRRSIDDYVKSQNQAWTTSSRARWPAAASRQALRPALPAGERQPGADRLQQGPGRRQGRQDPDRRLERRGVRRHRHQADRPGQEGLRHRLPDPDLLRLRLALAHVGHGDPHRTPRSSCWPPTRRTSRRRAGLTDLRAKHKVAPARAEVANQDPAVLFASGQLASSHTSTAGILSLLAKVGNKFKYQDVLFPKGRAGRAATTPSPRSSRSTPRASSRRRPDLIVTETSTEAGVYSVTDSQYQPTARKSVWAPEIKRIPGLRAGVEMDEVGRRAIPAPVQSAPRSCRTSGRTRRCRCGTARSPSSRG